MLGSDGDVGDGGLDLGEFLLRVRVAHVSDLSFRAARCDRDDVGRLQIHHTCNGETSQKMFRQRHCSLIQACAGRLTSVTTANVHLS